MAQDDSKAIMPIGIYNHKPHTEETKRKMSETRKRLGITPPSSLGKKRTQETKDKISEALKGNKNGLGKECSPEKRKKISDAQKGEKSHHWKGGISYQPYPEEWNETLKNSIRQRDGYACQECGIHQDELDSRFKKLDVHHIDYNKDNLDPKNLITLCKSCHTKTNFNRDYWINYFK